MSNLSLCRREFDYMKPCLKNRKRITWLALDALELTQARKLRAHVETCGGCRRYLKEISAVAQALKAPHTEADIESQDYFHRRVLAALKAEESTRKWPVARVTGLLNWRVVAPVCCGLALLILALSNFVWHTKAP